MVKVRTPAEARVRTGGVAGPLALDANGGAAKRRDGDPQEVPGVGHGRRALT